MTIENIGDMLDLLESNYGQKFYDGVNRKNVVKTWLVMFRDDDPALVMRGVQDCINTMTYKPTIADVRKRMAKAKVGRQMTEIEAFQAIKDAWRKATNREKAVQLFNELPPICRKIVGTASQLRDWQAVSEDTFETVVASMIGRAYREYAEQELTYAMLPKHLQTESNYMITAPEQEALPEPEYQKSVDEIIAEANKKSAEHGMQMTPELMEKNASKVQAFLTPMTVEELKRMDE